MFAISGDRGGMLWDDIGKAELYLMCYRRGFLIFYSVFHNTFLSLRRDVNRELVRSNI